MVPKLIQLGGWFAFAGVAVGAFGRHALENSITPHFLEVFEIGVHYHLIHALAIFAAAFCASQPQQKLTKLGTPFALLAGYLFASGICIFSGSLYLLAISGIKILGAITPLGGLCFLSGWVLLALSVTKEKV